MASQQPRWRPGRVVIATLFVALGMLFLLNNFGLLAPGWWRDLWRLWPLLLVIIGAEIILSRMGGWGVALMVLLLVGVALVVGLLLSVVPRYSGGGITRATEHWVEPLGDLKSAELAIDVGAGTFDIAALPPSATELIDADLTYERAALFSDSSPSKSVRRSGAAGRLRIGGANGANFWDVRLSPAIEWDIKVNAGAVRSQLDLSQLLVKSLELKVGASDVTVRFPANAGYTRARLEGGASNLSLYLPPAVAATIYIDSPLSSLDVDEGRFVRRNGYYSSGDPAAPNRLELSLNTGVSHVSIR